MTIQYPPSTSGIGHTDLLTYSIAMAGTTRT
jgi:hypothetical protein